MSRTFDLEKFLERQEALQEFDRSIQRQRFEQSGQTSAAVLVRLCIGCGKELYVFSADVGSAHFLWAISPCPECTKLFEAILKWNTNELESWGLLEQDTHGYAFDIKVHRTRQDEITAYDSERAALRVHSEAFGCGGTLTRRCTGCGKALSLPPDAGRSHPVWALMPCVDCCAALGRYHRME